VILRRAQQSWIWEVSIWSMRDLFEIVPASLGRGARRPCSCSVGGKWLDAMLPPDAVVLADFRYRALLPRPFVVGNRWLLTAVPNWKQQLTAFVKGKQVRVLVTRYLIKSPLLVAGKPQWHPARRTSDVPQCGSQSIQSKRLNWLDCDAAQCRRSCLSTRVNYWVCPNHPLRSAVN
jgi:hypothetical protein